ncbi:MAG: pyridoxamine 5'-phosphate oxidase family protein [Dehalobacter sp.]|nr:pyridoxamine 5'-phosphate oxidase family protein [Dehalobacter sp.]
MPKLNSEIQGIFSKQDVFPVATAALDGTPNVMPMSFVKVLDEDSVLIVDNFMNKTRKNLETNPVIAVSIWDMQSRKSYQIKGKAAFVDSGKIFDNAKAWVAEKMPSLQPKAAVVLKVEKIFNCSPGPNIGQEI